ncbi:hypothetical protein D3C87_1644380 [compost metagenome]
MAHESREGVAFIQFVGLELDFVISAFEGAQRRLNGLRVFLLQRLADNVAHDLRVKEIDNSEDGTHHRHVDLVLLFQGNADGINNSHGTGFELQLLLYFLRGSGGVDQNDAVLGNAAGDVHGFV